MFIETEHKAPTNERKLDEIEQQKANANRLKSGYICICMQTPSQQNGITSHVYCRSLEL